MIFSSSFGSRKERKKMESSESGSMQSSNGCDDKDFDSSAIAAFTSFSSPASSTFKNHIFTYPLPSRESLWSKNIGSAPFCSDIAATLVDDFTPSSSQQTFSGQLPSQSRPVHSSNAMVGPKPTKKRSRASRRAPTTVLTTDTSNFRAMVQEFTGIPAPPFGSSQFSKAAKLDIFGGRSTMDSSQMLPANPLSPFLLKPFPQSVHPLPSPFPYPPPPPFSSTVEATTTTTRVSSFPSSNTSIDLLTKLNKQQPLNLFHAHGNTSMELPMTSDVDKLNVLKEFGIVHGHGGSGVPPLQSSSDLSFSHKTTVLRRNDGEAEGDYAKPFSGSYNLTQRVNNAKVNFSGNDASPFAFHGESYSRNGEGIAESWICSSDI